MTTVKTSASGPTGAPARVLIVGAGVAGRSLSKALDRELYFIAGLVDDDPTKLYLDIGETRVLGAVDEIPKLVERHCISELLIAVPSASGSQLLHILNACTKSFLPFRSVPFPASLFSGSAGIAQLQEVRLPDLLSREPLRTGSSAGLMTLSGRVVMVTGAGGSIGSELCRQILRSQPQTIICVDQSETPLFYLQQRLGASQQKTNLVYSLTDIAHQAEMRFLLDHYRVDAIFHAAAYKHVPMGEATPQEALRNNVFALMKLLEVAEEANCRDFVLLSSDKAVNPSSIMGCTKRLGEMILATRPRSAMRCFSIRFGNVLGSQGSVIPIFKQQILSGKRLAITHPEMTRYFVTIPEAASFILQAFGVGSHGDILVVDMGKPIKIVDLAHILLRLLQTSEDGIEMVYTGARTGEKLHEQLYYEAEVPALTSATGISRVESVSIAWDILSRDMGALHEIALTRDGDLIRKALRRIIPEYGSQTPLDAGALIDAVRGFETPG